MDINRELEALKPFSIALGEENRLLFEQMLSDLDPETLKKASLARDPFEVIAMALSSLVSWTQKTTNMGPRSPLTAYGMGSGGTYRRPRTSTFQRTSSPYLTDVKPRVLRGTSI